MSVTVSDKFIARDIHDCDMYWLERVASIAATKEEVQQMDKWAGALREYVEAAKQRRQNLKHARFAENYGSVRGPGEWGDFFTSRDECEERSRADLIIVRTAADAFLVRCLSDAAKIAFESYLSAHRVSTLPDVGGSDADYVFRLHEVEAIGRLAVQFNLKVYCMGGAQL